MPRKSRVTPFLEISETLAGKTMGQEDGPGSCLEGQGGGWCLVGPPFPNARLGSQFLSHKHSDTDTQEGKDGTSKGLA